MFLMSSIVLDTLVSTLFSFAFLSIATMGIVLICKTSSTTNFAQGMIGIFGAYFTSYLISPKGKPEGMGFINFEPNFLQPAFINLALIPLRKIT